MVDARRSLTSSSSRNRRTLSLELVGGGLVGPLSLSRGGLLPLLSRTWGRTSSIPPPPPSAVCAPMDCTPRGSGGRDRWVMRLAQDGWPGEGLRCRGDRADSSVEGGNLSILPIGLGDRWRWAAALTTPPSHPLVPTMPLPPVLLRGGRGGLAAAEAMGGGEEDKEPPPPPPPAVPELTEESLRGLTPGKEPKVTTTGDPGLACTATEPSSEPKWTGDLLRSVPEEEEERRRDG
mmetsp:Transcript_11643/g.33631  ORF Transcript_11643/g.33631 Transcript_11643/m.33631 type:complete len:234 (+) Transcript_11643:2039-2740(+)